MKALVTGANGLVGANLVREILGAGHEVRAFVRQKSDRRSLDGLDVETVFGDVLDRNSIKRAAQGCDVLFHAAAVFAYWNHTAEALKKVAVEGTLNTVNAAHAAGAFGGNGAGGSGGDGGTGGIAADILQSGSIVTSDMATMQNAMLGVAGAGGRAGLAGRHGVGTMLTTGVDGQSGASGGAGTSAFLLETM